MHATDAPENLVLQDDRVRLALRVDDAGRPRVAAFGSAGEVPRAGDRMTETSLGAEARDLSLPLVDIVVVGSGRSWSGRRYVESELGSRLGYVAHQLREEGRWRGLTVVLADEETGLRVEVQYRLLVGVGVLTSKVLVANDSDRSVHLEAVTSLLLPGIEGSAGALEGIDLHWCENDWLAEGRWRSRELRDALPDLNRAVHQHDARGWFGLTSSGGWSSGHYLPMGAVVDELSGRAWLWQVEHNGAWHWQVGERSSRRLPGGAPDAPSTGWYLAVLGPTRLEHDCAVELRPGATFETVPATIAVSTDGFAGAVAGMTRYRRAARRSHRDHRTLPVVFNDYMNTLMGDPTTARLIPLVDAAAAVGAECFCIDAGWFAGVDEKWWSSVGRWLPSTERFPQGLEEVLDRIREHGMVPGLWLEPEVVGVASELASELPDEAFFMRDGTRLVEQGRHHLDLRHPAARRHLDDTVERLVAGLGVGYLKLDYNIDPGPGTDVGGESVGAGLLGHNRALVDWIDGLLDRYPDLTIESCASGGLRTDDALLARCQLHSTSDQQDYLRYPAIAAASLAAVPPEQAAIWSYPQPDWKDEEITFALVTGLVGRLYLSGHLDKMDDHQLGLVAEAVRAHKAIREDIAQAVPFWPIGLPSWRDPWVCVGLRARHATLLAIWHRFATDSDSSADPRSDGEITIELPELAGVCEAPVVVFPRSGSVKLDWRPDEVRLEASLADAPSACLVTFAAAGYARSSGGER